MLFDHGCDAINAGLMCIPMGAVVASGWTTKLYLCIFSGFVPFYFQTWEEYYIGSMVLPPFNGPTEGLLIAASMCVGSFFLGPDFWQTVRAVIVCVVSVAHFALSEMVSHFLTTLM
jgi:ethanolaminephosphotransferase